MSNLPRDILTEIFLRLPLNSLLTCKLVSKQLNNQINDPNFLKLYKNNSTLFFPRNNTLYCLPTPDHSNKIRPRRIPTALKNDPGLPELLREPLKKVICIKSPNGYFCAHHLLTGGSHHIPDAPLPQRSSLWHAYGFGYNHHEDDYKILVVAQEDINTGRNLLLVYSFRERGWKQFVGFHDRDYTWRLQSAGYCFNGVLHWVVMKIKDGILHSLVIASLSLHGFGFEELTLPGTAAYTFGPDPSLGELGNELCCCHYHYTIDRFDVWVMKEYGVSESWVKVFSIEKLAPPSNWVAPPEVFRWGGGAEVGVFVCGELESMLLRYDERKGDARVVYRTAAVDERVAAELKRAILVMAAVVVWVVVTTAVFGAEGNEVMKKVKCLRIAGVPQVLCELLGKLIDSLC